LQRLPRAYRLPILLCCIEGYSQEEAARQLGWTPGSVKGRLERGRARLQTRLIRRGFMLSAALMAVEAARGRVGAVMIETTVRAGVGFAARQTSAGAADSLAEMVLRGMAWSRGLVWAGLATALFVAAGTGTLALQILASKPTESEPATAIALEQLQQPKARTDRHGDPLPPRAIARLGTVRFRGVEAALGWRDDRGGGIFWLSPDDERYPALAIRVSGDLADVHYFPRDGHPGFRCLGGEGLPQGGLTTFVYRECEPATGEKILNKFVVSFEIASAVAREFFRTEQMSEAVPWFEL
jgi:hypothetical protein